MSHHFSELPHEQLLRIDQICSRFELAWHNETPPAIEDVLKDALPEDRPFVLRELIAIEIDYRRKSGATPTVSEYRRRFPNAQMPWLAELLAAPASVPPTASPPDPVRRQSESSSRIRKLGDYRLLRKIGSGGMGTVYLAEHERMGRTVALKVLRPEVQRDPQLMQRFDREVRAAASLNHPNIVAALDAREFQGVHFLVTEFVDGTDLDRLVRTNGPVSAVDAAEMLIQVAKGLQYAHERGIIHRDIKPANLLRDRAGVVRILDMGLARIDAGEDHSGTALTISGIIMGTAAYMAPEQARNTRRADARSDLYSLGCTLYFLIHGQPPYTGETAIDILVAHATLPVPKLAAGRTDVPPELEAIYGRMMVKDPDERFASVSELLLSLTAFTQNQRVPHNRSARRGQSRTKRMNMVAVAAAAVLLLAVLAALIAGRWNQSVPQREDVVPTAAVPSGSVTPEVRTSTDSAPSDQTRSDQVSGDSASGTQVSDDQVSDDTVTAPETTAVGDLLPATAHHRGGLRFNGRSSYVAVSTLVPEAGATYTLEAVVRPRTFRTSNVISWLGPDWMAVYLSANGHWGVARRLGSRSIVLSGIPEAQIDRTVHVAGVFGDSAPELLVNGIRVDTQTQVFNLPETSGGLYVGGVASALLPADQNDRFFDGDILGVRITAGRRELTPEVISDPLQADQRTLVLLPFSEGTGAMTRTLGELSVEAPIVNAFWIQDSR
jgi:serine/threonine protein kinase